MISNSQADSEERRIHHAQEFDQLQRNLQFSKFSRSYCTSLKTAEFWDNQIEKDLAALKNFHSNHRPQTTLENYQKARATFHEKLQKYEYFQSRKVFPE